MRCVDTNDHNKVNLRTTEQRSLTKRFQRWEFTLIEFMHTYMHVPDIYPLMHMHLLKTTSQLLPPHSKPFREYLFWVMMIYRKHIFYVSQYKVNISKIASKFNKLFLMFLSVLNFGITRLSCVAWRNLYMLRVWMNSLLYLSTWDWSIPPVRCPAGFMLCAVQSSVECLSRLLYSTHTSQVLSSTN